MTKIISKNKGCFKIESTKLNLNSELLNLMNVGEATIKDLQLLNITSIEELAEACPDELYIRLQEITGKPMIPVYGIYLLQPLTKLILAKSSLGGNGQKFVRKENQKVYF